MHGRPGEQGGGRVGAIQPNTRHSASCIFAFQLCVMSDVLRVKIRSVPDMGYNVTDEFDAEGKLVAKGGKGTSMPRGYCCSHDVSALLRASSDFSFMV